MRPTAVLVIGILGILIGIAGLCCGGLGSLLAGFQSGLQEAMSPEQRNASHFQMLNDPTYSRFVMVSAGMTALLSILLLVSSILLLQMKPLGYTLMMTTCALIVVGFLLLAVVEATMMAPVYQKYNQSQRALWSYLLYFIYPAIAFWVLTRPAIKEAFRG